MDEISSNESNDASGSEEESKAKSKTAEAPREQKLEADPLAEMQLSDPEDAGNPGENETEEEAREKRNRLRERATKTFAHVQKSQDDIDLLEKGIKARKVELSNEPGAFDSL